MKILHIQVLPKLSGVQRVSLEIFRSLPADFEKYVLFSDSTDCGDRRQCVEEFEKTGAKVLFSPNLKREISPKDDLRALKEIYRLCKRERFDIVHTNSTKPGIVGRIAARLAGVPKVIHTVHGLAFHKYVGFPKWQFYWACEMVGSAFSHRIAIVNRFYTKYFRLFHRKVLTVYNGMDFTAFAPVAPNRRMGAGEGVRILFVGRLDPPKNPLMLLKVAEKVCARYPDTKFTLVGDGEFMDDCRSFVAEHGLSRNVELAGWQGDTARFYAGHDIFAMTSIYEAFGLIFLEAGYYELPVVATDVEGIPEVVEQGVTGLLSAPNDVERFAANLIRLIENPEERVAMGRAGRTRVTTRFNSERMCREYLDLYNG